MSKRIYLAGPMSGYKEFNFPAFDKATRELRAQGYTVFNPAENDRLRYGEDFLAHPEKFNPRQTMADDCRWICNFADAIALLPGWEKSKGVSIEKALADYLKLEVIYI